MFARNISKLVKVASNDGASRPIFATQLRHMSEKANYNVRDTAFSISQFFSHLS